MKKLFNKINIAALTLAASMTFSSCEDFLETTPYDFIAPETFYKTESDCKMALAGVYWSLVREWVYGNNYANMISNIDDLSYYQRNAGQIASQVYGNDHNPSNIRIWQTWEELYKGINNANMLIENIDNAEITDNIKLRIKGEAKFLRAYYHFLLVQAWYEVPIRKESFKDVSKSPMPATPHREAIQWIIDEMEACVNMVDDMEYNLSPSHVKKTTVMGILARVYLWQAGKFCEGGEGGKGSKNSYEKAAYWANQVKISQKHDLNPDIYTIWKNMAADKYDTEYNETIWEAEFYGNRNADGLGNYTDGKIGSNIGNLQETGEADGPGYSYGFYAGTLILWDLFDENDARRSLSMADYKINNKGEIKSWNKKQIIERTCGKYRREWETSSMKEKNYTPYNYPILRYADVLLMLAEAENELNQQPTDLAYEAINQVRKRTGAGLIEKGKGYQEFQQIVRDERARELCFESLRKYDLIRWGIYVDAIHNKLGTATQDSRWTTNNAKYTSCQIYANNTTDKHQFLPIPTTELDVNIALEQNKFWK